MKALRQLERASALAILTAVVACTTTATVPVGSPETTRGAVTESRPNATRGTSAQDENIRVADGRNVRGAASTATAPANKAPAGSATRGASTCAVHFDNRSRLHIATYVDGYSTGDVGPYGDVYTYAVAGPTRLYGRAGFTDGTWVTWGPVVVDCPAGGSYTWRLWYTD